MSERFTRTVEDFTCGHCGETVTGDGYTNHCPACMWSRHVDIDPGDRASECGGMMQPIQIMYEQSEFHVLHRCIACGHEKKNRTSDRDDLAPFM